MAIARGRKGRAENPVLRDERMTLKYPLLQDGHCKKREGGATKPLLQE
jgi:hypothetical protein